MFPETAVRLREREQSGVAIGRHNAHKAVHHRALLDGSDGGTIGLQDILQPCAFICGLLPVMRSDHRAVQRERAYPFQRQRRIAVGVDDRYRSGIQLCKNIERVREQHQTGQLKRALMHAAKLAFPGDPMETLVTCDTSLGAVQPP